MTMTVSSAAPETRARPSRPAFFEEVADDFEAVNAVIMEQLHSEVPLVEKIGHYIIEGGGKRLRPLLVLLACRALGYGEAGRDHLKLATIIEFLHTATLLHDDVVDTSDLRRGRATANALWGNAPSVLVGDFLYSRAFQMMVELDNMRIMGILSNGTNVIAEGEVMQLVNCRNPDVDEAHYMEVIRCKTAMLFQVSAEAGAVLAGASEEQIGQLRNFGLHLGLAFQIIDDYLDYSSSAEEMGKNVGDDLAEGKTTLPLIHAMREGSEAEAALIRKAIRKGGLDDLDRVLAAVESSGALQYTTACAKRQSERALACLEYLPASPYRTALQQLTEFSVSRSF